MPMERLAALLRNGSGHLVVAMAFAVPVSNALTSVLALAFLVVSLVGIPAGSWRGRGAFVLQHPVVIASFVLYGVVLAGAAWSDSPPGGQLVRNLSLLLLPLFGLVLQTGPWARRCWTAFSLAMALTLVLSLGHGIWRLVGSGVWRLPFQGDGDAIFHVHITHNVLMSLAVLLWLARALTPGAVSNRLRALLFAGSALAIFNILWMVPGRTGYATLLAALLTLLFLHCRPSWRLPGVLALIALVGAAALLSDSLQGRIDRTWREMQAFSGADAAVRGDVRLADYRLAIWREALPVIAQSPWWGHGTGSYHAAFCAHAQPKEMCQFGGGKHPHNQFLFAAIEGGALLAACYAAWLLALAFSLWQRRRESDLGTVGVGLWLVWMVYAMVDTPLQLLTERTLFPLLFAVALFAPLRGERKSSASSTSSAARPAGAD